jgi:vacuolar protein-sorting-associated protein 4
MNSIWQSETDVADAWPADSWKNYTNFDAKLARRIYNFPYFVKLRALFDDKTTVFYVVIPFHSMSINFCFKGIEWAKKAVEEDAAGVGHEEEAIKAYQMAIEYFIAAAKYERNEKRKATYHQKATEYLKRAEALKQAPAVPLQPAPTPVAAEDEKLRHSIRSTILPSRPNVRWDDIAGLFHAKEALKEAVILPVRFPSIFSGLRETWKGILLYGPPGTGKSFLAKAVATESRSVFFSVSSADLVSKWQGESERLVKALFETAREQRPAVIFIDEIDSLCGARGDGQEAESSRRVKTQFLTQMEGVGNDMQDVLVLAATNTPWSLDMAIRRRFEKRIYIPLPSKGARTTMFRLHLGTQFESDDLQTLAEMTEHYSGSDIRAIVREAAMIPVRIALSATHFKSIDNKWTPCSPGDPTGREMSMLTDVKDEELCLPRLTLEHLRQSIASTRPTVSTDDLLQYEQWTRTFGQEG